MAAHLLLCRQSKAMGCEIVHVKRSHENDEPLRRKRTILRNRSLYRHSLWQFDATTVHGRVLTPPQRRPEDSLTTDLGKVSAVGIPL